MRLFGVFQGRQRSAMDGRIVTTDDASAERRGDRADSEAASGYRPPHQRFTMEKVRSGRAGNPVYRLARPFKGFRRDVDGHLEATLDIERPTGRFGKLRRLLIGQPIHSELEVHERLTKKKALAVFSS